MECGSSRTVTIQLVDEEAGPGARGPQPFRGQVYEAIRAACLDSGVLFRDPCFPAGPDALGYDTLGPDSEKAKGVEWKRPHEFCAEPQFICEDMSRTDVCQGSLGNCWLLAAAAALTLHPRLLCRVVPPGQGFQDGYAGVFHFQVEARSSVQASVAPDGRFSAPAPAPTGSTAPMRGCAYEVMRGGHMNEAFVDFTGGVGEVLYLRQDTPGLFSALRHALVKESLVGATALSDRGEYRTEDGLVRGHAYSVTGTHKVSSATLPMLLSLDVGRAWGGWVAGCPRWDALPAEWREALLVKKEDGEFWMELQDFLRHFNTVQICSLSPEVLGPNPAGGGWHIHTFQGRWVRGFNSGGSQPSAETFWTNPQFLLTLLEPDEEEDDEDEEGPWGGWGAGRAGGPGRGGRIPKCTVLLSLIQRNRRKLRAKGLTYLTVGFHVFQIPEEVGLRCGPAPIPRPALGLGRPALEGKSRGLGAGRARPGGLGCSGGEGLGRELAREIDDVISADLEALMVPYKPLELELAQLFLELAGESLNASQLQTLLSIALEPGEPNTRTPREIGVRTCEQLLRSFGHGPSLALHHFQQLWSHLLATFDKFDEDSSGTMNSYELRLALNAAGFHLNNQLTQALTSRYRDSRLRVDFERFVSCAAQLTCIFRHCSQHLDGGEGVVCLTRRQAMTWSAVSVSVVSLDMKSMKAWKVTRPLWLGSTTLMMRLNSASPCEVTGRVTDGT
uniref:Calpain 12 n=1 Tax=Spermophilus dauricus TaxID=99837 RepID=A0A8C9UJP0_SPEDA